MNYNKLIDRVKKTHLCKITFEAKPLTDRKDEKITITKQHGNNSGHIVIVVVNQNGDVLDVNYKFGSYASIPCIKENINEIFEILNELKKQSLNK